MKRIKLPKDVWVSLYGRLHDTLSHATRIKEVNKDDVRDEVLNIMNFYFDKGFKVGITEDTKTNIPEYHSALAKLKMWK
jgi:hypothetical protein